MKTASEEFDGLEFLKYVLSGSVSIILFSFLDWIYSDLV
jgi:hypothetical protein